MTHARSAAALVSLFAGVVLAGACGGDVTIADGTGGTSASSSKSTTSNSTGNTTGTGSTACASHADCPGGLCIFSTGVCSKACDATSLCGGGCDVGTECQDCATSSCPGCKNCMAACAPIGPKRCDENDACDSGEICIWATHECAPPCNAAGGCDDPSRICADCATGSCCGCENCVPACVHPVK